MEPKVGEIIFFRVTLYTDSWVKTVVQDVDPDYKHICIYLGGRAKDKKWIPYHYLTPNNMIYIDPIKKLLYNNQEEPKNYRDLT